MKSFFGLFVSLGVWLYFEQFHDMTWCKEGFDYLHGYSFVRQIFILITTCKIISNFNRFWLDSSDHENNLSNSLYQGSAYLFNYKKSQKLNSFIPWFIVKSFYHESKDKLKKRVSNFENFQIGVQYEAFLSWQHRGIKTKYSVSYRNSFY